MPKLISSLRGRKTYLTVGLMVVFHLASLALGKETSAAAWQGLMEAAAFAGLRNAI